MNDMKGDVRQLLAADEEGEEGSGRDREWRRNMQAPSTSGAMLMVLATLPSSLVCW
jgi:hypothetical protein